MNVRIGMLACAAALGAVVVMFAHRAAALDKSGAQAASNGAGAGAPEMQWMARTFVGRWTVAETHEPSAWSPRGATGSGTAVFSAGPGGLSLLQEYRSTTTMGAFEGHGVTWWNASDRGYVGIWCENTNPAGCIDSGAVRREGDRLVAEYSADTNGQPTRVRRVVTDISPSSFSVTIDMAIGDKPLRRAVTVRYTRQGAAGERSR